MRADGPGAAHFLAAPSRLTRGRGAGVPRVQGAAVLPAPRLLPDVLLGQHRPRLDLGKRPRAPLPGQRLQHGETGAALAPFPRAFPAPKATAAAGGAGPLASPSVLPLLPFSPVEDEVPREPGRAGSPLASRSSAYGAWAREGLRFLVDPGDRSKPRERFLFPRALCFCLSEHGVVKGTRGACQIPAEQEARETKAGS